MDDRFFEQPILNSPYEYPSQHWELDAEGQPTNRVLEHRRRAEFITPIPKAKKRKKKPATQEELGFDDTTGVSTEKQKYDPTPIINELRGHVDTWRALPNPNQWHVTPETARLLQHWRHHKFSSIRPFFCQVEAIETLIWLLVHRHRLQRGELLRSPRLLSRRERSVQGAQDHAKSRDQRGGVGHASQRHLPAVREARVWPNRGEGDQPPR